MEKNFAEALKWYRKAADLGLADAQNTLHEDDKTVKIGLNRLVTYLASNKFTRQMAIGSVEDK